MIDLCVVSHNTKDLLKRLLDTLWSDQDQYKDYNLYVADNGSTDGTQESLGEYAYMSVPGDLFFWDNIGYSAACNQLAAKGSGDIIGLLNADVWLTSSDVAAIQNVFDAAPHIAILGPKQRNEEGRIVHAGILGPPTAPRHRDWLAYDPEDKLYKDRITCVSVSGSAYFIRRSVWNELTNCNIYRELYPDAMGAFLDTPHYYEETWCSYHARAHGHQVWYDGTISIGHTWQASNRDEQYLSQLMLTSRKIFRHACTKHKIPCD